MFGGIGASYKPKADLQPDLREVAREISLKTQVYVTPDELQEIVNFVPTYLEEQSELKEWDFESTENDVPQISKGETGSVEEFFFYFYAQTSTTTVLCQVVMNSDEHVWYNVKKIEW